MQNHQRVHSIADLTLAGGIHIDFSFLALDPSLLSSASILIEPLQDRPQTASALRLWQRANRLWCNTVTGGLHGPLGKWLVPGPQLWRVWPFYFDPDTLTLWSKAGEGFNVHSCILLGRDRRTTQFYLQTIRHETTLPSNSFPVECQETSTRINYHITEFCNYDRPTAHAEHSNLSCQSSVMATIPS
jgi:hypothetical protein